MATTMAEKISPRAETPPPKDKTVVEDAAAAPASPRLAPPHRDSQALLLLEQTTLRDPVPRRLSVVSGSESNSEVNSIVEKPLQPATAVRFLASSSRFSLLLP